MTAETGFVTAEFDGNGLFVTDTSPTVPAPSNDQPLLEYFNAISQTGWKAVRGRFNGWAIIFDLEQQTEIPYKPSSYMMLMLNQIPAPEGLSASVDLQSRFIDELQEIRTREKWEVLVGPKHFAKNGVWTISIWVRT